MSIIDDLYAILKGANPGTSDEDIHTQASQLAQHPDAANIMASFSSPSSYDVSTSTPTITQNGATPAAPSPVPMTTLPPAPSEPIGISSAPATTPIPAPTASASAPVQTATPVPTDTLARAITTPTTSQDATARTTELETEKKKHALGVIPVALGSIADAIGNASVPFGGKGASGAGEKALEQQKENLAQEKGDFEAKLKNDPNSDVSKGYRDMVTQIAPSIAQDPNFQTLTAAAIGDKLPLIDTMMKAKASEDARKLGLAQAQSNKELSLGLRNDQQQDKLEQNAKQMVANLRGDKSLARTEEQRDAAAVAYNRLNEIQASGKGVNPIDYTDILGQIYKARTGTAPSESIMKDIHQATAKGSLDKAYTYVTGQQAPATTKDITSSLMNMAQSMGKQADAFHQGYMNSHLIKPSGLDDARWQPIIQTGRGMSFAEATKQNPSSITNGTTSDPLGIR